MLACYGWKNVVKVPNRVKWEVDESDKMFIFILDKIDLPGRIRNNIFLDNLS
jgi:hypothetical protein